MPTLNWIGKDKVISHHLYVPYRVLDLQYTFNAEKNATPAAESKNKIIRGGQSRSTQSPPAAVRGQSEMHLYLSSLQHGQRRLGVQRQCERPAYSQMAGRNRRQAIGRQYMPVCSITTRFSPSTARRRLTSSSEPSLVCSTTNGGRTISPPGLRTATMLFPFDTSMPIPVMILAAI